MPTGGSTSPLTIRVWFSIMAIDGITSHVVTFWELRRRLVGSGFLRTSSDLLHSGHPGVIRLPASSPKRLKCHRMGVRGLRDESTKIPTSDQKSWTRYRP